MHTCASLAWSMCVKDNLLPTLFAPLHQLGARVGPHLPLLYLPLLYMTLLYLTLLHLPMMKHTTMVLFLLRTERTSNLISG